MQGYIDVDHVDIMLIMIYRSIDAGPVLGNSHVNISPLARLR